MKLWTASSALVVMLSGATFASPPERQVFVDASGQPLADTPQVRANIQLCVDAAMRALMAEAFLTTPRAKADEVGEMVERQFRACMAGHGYRLR